MAEPGSATDYVADPTAGAVGEGQPIPAAQQAAMAASAPKLQKSHEGEHHGDFGAQNIPITRSVKMFALCAALNSCNLGYDIGTSTAAAKLIQEQWVLTDEQRELFIGALNFASMFGAVASQYISDSYGRRQTFIIAAVGFIVGMLFQALAANYTLLMVGRCFTGLGVGVGLAIDPLYIAEMSPAKHRGELVTWSEIGINVGIVIGFSMGLFLAHLPDEIQWRTMFAMGTILPCAMIYLATKVMPETPRWYVLKFRYDEARSVLYSMYPTGYNVDLVIDDIKESLERERIAEETLGWSTILHPSPAFRRMLLVGLGMAAAQQLVGIDAIQYYLLDVIESSTDDKMAQNMILILLGCIKLSCIFVAGKFFDSRGRRPLVFISLIGLTFSLLTLSITFYVAGQDNPNTIFTVLGLGLYLAFFSVGMGPAAWLIPSEVFATCIRAKAMSLATLLNRLVATIFSSSFLTMKDTLSWEGFFFLLATICVIVLFYLYFLLPETKGHSLEDMSLYFAEITGDFSILDAEKKIRLEQELQVSGALGPGGEVAPHATEPEGGTLT